MNRHPLRGAMAMFALTVSSAIPVASADVTLVKERTVPVGVDARAVRLLDMNGDGYPELVSLSETQGVLSVLMNESATPDNETISFGGRDIYDVGEQPTEIGIGDIDGDGRADVVAASREDNVIVVFLVRDAGALVEAARLDAGDGPYDVFVRDLDGDGDNDLLVGERVGDSVGIHLSDGDGYGFAARRGIGTVNETRQIAPGDFDADGDVDFAVAGERLQIYLNDGGARFDRSQTLDPGELLQSTVAADLDEDGADDLLVTGLENQRLYVLRAAAGRFTTDSDSEYFDAFYMPLLPNVLIGEDIDGDGHEDAVLASRSNAQILVLTGTGHGGLESSQLVTEANAISSIAVGDVDGDGRNDLIAMPQDENDAIVYRGMGSMPYDLEETIELGGAPAALATDRVTPDAIRVLAADSKRRLVHVLQITADAAALVGEIPVMEVPSIVRSRPLDDASEVFHSPGSGSVIERARLGAGHVPEMLPAIVVGGGYAHWLPGSFSAPGARELLVIEADGDAVLKRLDDTGDADIASITLPGLPLFAIAGDLDGDGTDEAVLVDKEISVLSASGGVMRRDVQQTLRAVPDQARLKDAGDDGRPDLLLVYGDEHRIDVHRNLDGAFATVPVSAVTAFRPSDATTPDIDGNGRNDLAITVASDNGIELHERTADGSYRIVNRITTDRQATEVIALPFPGGRATPLLASFGTEDHLKLFRRSDNRAPVAEDLSFDMKHGETLEGWLEAADEDGDALHFTLTLPPESGTLTLLDPVTGHFQYKPSGSGDVYAHYAVSDQHEASQPAVVRISVEESSGGGSTGSLLLALMLAAFRGTRRH